MQQWFSRGLTVSLAAALGFGAAACDSGNLTVPTPPATVTEVFTGTLGQGVRLTHSFEIPVLGGVTAQIISVDPTDAAVMGFLLGSWDGTTCRPILLTSAALLGSSLAGIAQPSTMCVQLFDVGNYADEVAVTYAVSVTRPTVITVQ